MFTFSNITSRPTISVDPKVAMFEVRRHKALTCHAVQAYAQAIVLASALATVTLFAYGAETAKAEQTDWDRAWSLLTKQDRPLSAIVLMEKMVENKKLPAQTLAQFYAVTGDERGTNTLMDQGAETDASPPEDTTGYAQKSAVDTIVRAARDRRVVILNESHDRQRHRAFALEVALQLRKVGFTHFGAETFSRDLSESMKDGAPSLKTGVYTLDPIFADLARQAAVVGYQLFDFEQRPDQKPSGSVDRILRTTAREQAQAENIKKLLDANPNARLLVYVGGQHASKIPDQDNVAWMALRLKRMTGLDPLTIDQTVGTPRGRADLDHPLYRGIANLSILNYPVILTNAAGQSFPRPGYDLLVLHPRVSDIAGRPGWLEMNGYRKSYALKLAPIPSRTLIRAFVRGESSGSIAMDQILVSANQTEVTLMLPVGQYSVVQQTETGESTQIDSIVVLDKGR